MTGIFSLWSRASLSTRILTGLGLGIFTGLFLGDPAAALQPIADIYIRLMQMTVLPYIVLSLLVNLGRLALYLGDYGGAKAAYERALEYSERVGNQQQAALSLNNMGMVWEQRGDLERAAYHLERYIEITGGTPDLREHLMELREKSK